MSDQNSFPFYKKDKKDIVDWIDIDDIWNGTFTKKYTYIDLFAGAGGLSLGLNWAGFTGIAGVEFMKHTVETYRQNFNHPIIDKDIRSSETKNELYDIAKDNNSIDLISGGFPCQGFSMSGQRVVSDKRNSLYNDMVEVIDHLKPKYVVMENVVGLRSMLKGEVEKKIISDLESIGYKVSVAILNAADYYVPQLRERIIFIANSINNINYYPEPLLKKGEYKTTEDGIGDLINHPEDKEFNHEIMKHSEEMKKRLSNVAEGNSLYNNYSDSWKKCHWERPSCTIKENHGGVNIHPRVPRVLTVREMARLQSFPDEFIFSGAKKWQYVQVGNAVPPLLGKAIGLAVRKSLIWEKEEE